MRRFLTLVCLLCLAIPAGISISGCTRNPDANYCNGFGYGPKVTDVSSILLQPQTTGISLAFGQTQQALQPNATACHGATVAVSSFTYGSTNTQLVDISPSGNICAGTWNRNTGGGIANYTTCSKPNPLPSTGGLPYGIAYITASANSVSSNPVAVYVHPQVTSVDLALSGTQQCYSQGTQAQLDSQACFAGGNNQQIELCAPASLSTASYACTQPTQLVNGVLQTLPVPSCSVALGTLNYLVGSTAVGTVNNETNQITAEQPGTTEISVLSAGSASSAGYFSTCPPKSINVTLANGTTKGTITQGVTQNLVTTILDTNNLPITGLNLDYQSTDPIDISVGSSGGIATNFPGVASIYAICQPSICNSSPINTIGLYGTGLSISSNPVTVTTPGTASDYIWVAAPGQSQYFVPVELLTGTLGSPVRMPYVPNSMVMDQSAQNLYFGSSRELMIYSTIGNTLSKQDINAPGVVLAVSPDNSTILINDQIRHIFYLYNSTAGVNSSTGGVGNAAAWTPDSKTLYITDNASLGPDHSDKLYIYNQNTGWTSYPLPPSPLPTSALQPNVGVPGTKQTPALTIPSVGAYLRGAPTSAHTWCPSGTVGNSASILLYPQGDSVLDASNNPVRTDTLAATTDGNHILGAAFINGGITLSDIGVTIPSSTECPGAGSNTLTPLTIQHTLNQAVLSKANATSVNQVIASPASNLAFITYTGSTPGASLPYYVPGSGGAAGSVGYLTLTGSSTITAPLAGAFSPDDSLFFVSTAGDNMIHYLSVPLVTSNPAKADTQQIAPNLPACTPVANGGVDAGCTLTTPTTNPVPATVIVVKPRSTT
jgi:sugar lactone lactonase YvrE